MSVLSDLLAPYSEQCQEYFQRWLVEPGTPASLAESMRYCVMGGGKRLRPALVLLSARAAGQDQPDELTARAAVAVELIHTYSLVHDDLPSMDDDQLRRGRPTAHVQFGEALAILTGDALLTRAFGLLAESNDPRAARLAALLATGAGAAGMVAGQVADMGLCKIPTGQEGLEYIPLRKTAALIVASVKMGAVAAQASPKILNALEQYAWELGLAFQYVDDLLDVVGSTEQLGKAAGKDEAAGKRTLLSEQGIDGLRRTIREITQKAKDYLAPLGERGEPLRQLVEQLAERSH